jgi:hypothetical protein
METKIAGFRKAVKEALCKLDPSLNPAWSNFWECGPVAGLMGALQQGSGSVEKWPTRLIEQEKNATAAALFETMNIMQQAVIAADSFAPSVEFEDATK